ncbi:MAG TPA: hypothetical protein VMZ25_07790 [Terriglobales bacterium]|nr:hypothetical protein [Terriglobales bacterium]
MPSDKENPPFTPSDPEKESLFAKVTRESQERRAQSDRRSAVRRAAEMQEIARQVAARTPPKPKPAVSTDASADADSGEGIEDQPA